VFIPCVLNTLQCLLSLPLLPAAGFQSTMIASMCILCLRLPVRHVFSGHSSDVGFVLMFLAHATPQEQSCETHLLGRWEVAICL
jgi:hypothetical protein